MGLSQLSGSSSTPSPITFTKIFLLIFFFFLGFNAVLLTVLDPRSSTGSYRIPSKSMGGGISSLNFGVPSSPSDAKNGGGAGFAGLS